MKINFNQVLTSLDGQALKEGEKEATLKTVSVNALLSMGEEKMSGEEKAARYSLALKIYNEEKPDLKVEEIAKIKKAIGEAYLPLVVGRAYEMLELETE